MSFILDALKKSEAERQRKSTPGFADIPGARAPSGAPRWLWAVGGLLAINLAVLVTLLLRPGADAGHAASVTQRLELPETVPAPRVSDLVSAAKEEQREAEAAAAVEAPPARSLTETPAAEVPPEPAPARTRAPVDVGSLSTFEVLRANGTLQLPDLHVDLHVYGERPADRFVVINMSRYKEGAALAEGPRVLEILSNGIVLEQHGTRFFLPSP